MFDDEVRAPYVREKLLELCAVRRDANIHSQSQLNILCASPDPRTTLF